MVTTVLKFDPCREQRVAGIKDVVYEYGNLIASAHYSMNGHAPWRTNCDDAFLLGCRKLDDFLTKDSRSARYGQEQPDILALDYLPAGAVREWELPIWKGEWRDAMNKQLAHISYSRDKEWNHRIWVPQLEREFREAWLKFRNAVVDSEYKKEFDKQLADCQAKPGFDTVTLERSE
jgi:hypothetical protein